MNVTMSYAEYKKEWDKCKTVSGSYNAADKTIVVMVPDEIYELGRVIPAEEVESYRAELIASGSPEFADTYHILGLYADDFRGATIAEFDCATAEESAWIAKALQIVNK